MKPRRFFLHYNKPLSKQKKKHMWSVHFKDKCYFVEDIDCRVKTESKTNKTQPFVVMRGFANTVNIVKNKAVIE